MSVLTQRIREHVEVYAKRYPAFDIPNHYKWLNDRVAEGSYRGGSGTVTLSADKISVALDVPFFARLYQTRIEEFIQRELAEITAPESITPRT